MSTPVAYLKTFLIGRPKATAHLEHERLSNKVGLAVFASDNLSSSAYATEEMLLVLVLGGAAALQYSIPITAIIVFVFAVIVFSYRQTIHAYPSGGGAYTVAHDNLGRYPGLFAASSLLIDYVLTVSVSVAAGIAAVVSAVPHLHRWRVVLSVGVVLVVMLLNLRGVRESGRIFAVPTYAFLFSLGAMMAWGLVKFLILGYRPPPAEAIPAVQPITLFLLLRAFSHGCTAVTGVEAISNGVPAFRRPESQNAAKTLTAMGILLATLFIGTSGLARMYGVTGPDEEHHLTVVASIAQRVFGGGPMFFFVQASTAMILILAANTAYADFPRLSATLAKDRFAPGQLMNRGDRLAYSNGIFALAGLASALIVIFDADVTRLIQLYLVGVFTSLTLSQWGMVKHWQTLRGRRWRRYAGVNGFGAFSTLVVLAIVLATRFREGAWMVVIAIPLLVLWLNTVNRHYRDFGVKLRDAARRPGPAAGHSVVMLVGFPSEEERRALTYARLLKPADVRCVHFGSLADSPGLLRAWGERMPDAKSLEVIPSGDSLSRDVREYVRQLRRTTPPATFLTVLVPERFGHSRFDAVRNRSLFLVKATLLFTPGVVVTDVPYLEGRTQASPTAAEQFRHIALVLVAAVHNATLLALEYAKAMADTEVHAVHVQVDPDFSAKVIRDWEAWSPGSPLEVIEAPHRNLTGTVLEHVRSITADGNTIVTVLIPEFVLGTWWHHLLHNQSSLGLKRIFLLEPNVVVTSIPYAVGAVRADDTHAAPAR